jgi:hypothetical protein
MNAECVRGAAPRPRRGCAAARATSGRVGGEVDLPAPEPRELLDEVHLLHAVVEQLVGATELGERRIGG